MSDSYKDINFEAFSEVPGVKMTSNEKRRILENFYQEAGCYDNYKRKKGQIRSIVAVCACLILCLAASPIGDSTWAAVKQAFMGIGEYLGMTKQDDYATVVDQTQTKNGITVTLNDAIGSDNELRVSVTVVKDDGEVLGDMQVNIGDYSINGLNWKNGLKTTGVGPFGSKRTNGGGIYFMSASYYDFEMPLNPVIDMMIEAGDELFNFTFTLENEQFKKATRTVSINKNVVIEGKELILKDLIVSPIDQIITTENPEGLDFQWSNIVIYGEDNFGEEIVFSPYSGETFNAFRENEDETTYQPNQDVSSYTFRLYDLADADRDDFWNPKNAISEEFTVRLPD